MAEDLARECNQNSVDDLLQNTPEISTMITNIHERLCALGAPASIATVSPSRALTIPCKLSTIMGYIHKRGISDFKNRLSNEELALHRSSCGPGASAWMDVPLDPRYVIPNDRCVVAYKRRLLLPYPGHDVPPPVPTTCNNKTSQGRVCGKPLDQYGQHSEACAPGGNLVIRHDALTNCIAALARRGMDSRPKLEQVLPQLATSVAGQVSGGRMDVVLHNGTSRFLVDVVVCSPLAGGPRQIAANARRDGLACRRAAISKRDKYSDPELVPFAVETGGRLGGDARMLLKTLADATADPVKELAFAYRAVSAVLQDGVARQLLSH